MASLDTAHKYLTPTEASVVADVSLRDVNRAMDEHIIPDAFYELGARRVRASACALLNFYFHTAPSLTLKFRKDVIARVCERREYESTFDLILWNYTKTHAVIVEAKAELSYRTYLEKISKEWEIDDESYIVKFIAYFEATTKRFADLKDSKELVVEDPDILSGTPVIRGTRVPVYDVAASVRKGIPLDRIKAAYPSIDERAIELARIYADATPPRGRPKVSIKRPEGVTIKRVPRRSKR